MNCHGRDGWHYIEIENCRAEVRCRRKAFSERHGPRICRRHDLEMRVSYKRRGRPVLLLPDRVCVWRKT